MSEFFDGISQLESFKSAMESLSDSLKFLGLLSLVFILLIVVIIAAVVLAPTLISMMRNIKLKKFVAIANVIAIPAILINFTLPFIIWTLLLIIAITGKKEFKSMSDVPTIIINTSADYINKKDINKRSGYFGRTS